MQALDGGPGAKLRRELEACVEAWLRPYIDRLTRGDLQPRPKVINDAVWGSIRLQQWEVAILDTWLLQRLRYLRQLGVVHWVYPSGGHSRLEHSVGVLHQTEALLASIERTATGESAVLGDATHQLLRLAALLHDTGHAIMSHVSDDFVKKLPGVDDLRDELHREFRPRKRPSASEAFAAVFVQSPAFRELLAMPVVGASFIRDIAESSRQIAGLILGAPIIPGAAFLTFLVNGAFDADKLDYMPRDCMMTGVPSAVDVRRVIETVRVLRVPTDRVRGYADWAGCGDASTVDVLTLTGAGARALGELAMARSLLYEKVYFHHKVRALEVMARRALENADPRSLTDWLNLVDDEMLVGDTRARFARVRDRYLLKRAVVLTAPDDGEPNKQSPRERAWSDLMADLAEEPEVLKAQLYAESLRVADTIGRGRAALEDAPPEIDVPPINKIGLDQHAFVGDSVEEFSPASVALSGQRTEAGRRAAQQMVYVFAPEGAVLPVFVAARELLRRRYADLPIGPDAYRSTRLDPEMIVEAERTLAQDGYFGSDPPQPIPPARIRSHREEELETFLRTSRSRIEERAVVFGQYQPCDERPISPERVRNFLRQFRTERRARTMLLVLEAIDFKDRAYFARALTALMEAVTCATVAPFGSTGDSSAFTSYLMNDLGQELQRPVRPLELALDEDAPAGDIVLWDDFCGRAGHAATALLQWLALRPTEEDAKILVNEDLARPLSPTRLTAFRQRAVKIAFALARPTGIRELRKFVDRHALTNVTVLEPHANLSEADQTFATDRIIRNPDDRAHLREFLVSQMRKVLAHRGWSPDKLANRLLGYDNEAHLLVFSYNVPTVTLTPLWVTGTQDAPWEPLFIRRGKPAK